MLHGFEITVLLQLMRLLQNNPTSLIFTARAAPFGSGIRIDTANNLPVLKPPLQG